MYQRCDTKKISNLDSPVHDYGAVSKCLPKCTCGSALPLSLLVTPNREVCTDLSVVSAFFYVHRPFSNLLSRYAITVRCEIAMCAAAVSYFTATSKPILHICSTVLLGNLWGGRRNIVKVPNSSVVVNWNYYLINAEQHVHIVEEVSTLRLGI